ncbi:hypothetical protein QYM36_003932, partial [Artemia franciscana]
PSLAKLKPSIKNKFLKASTCNSSNNKSKDLYCCAALKSPVNVSPKKSELDPCHTSASINSQFCGISSRRSLRIIGGQRAHKGDWPWIVVLFDETGDGTFFCQGSLISSFQVLTAAHCFREVEAENVIARLGEYNLSDEFEGQRIEIQVDRVKIHEGYDSVSHANDIAIVYLSRGTCFTEHIRPICIPDLAFQNVDLTGTTVSVAGWGRTHPNTLLTSNILQEINVQVVEEILCRNIYSIIPTAIISKHVICAGDPGGKKDACQGDSGSPLILKEGLGKRSVQVGIVSSGVGCGSPLFPGIYTRVSEYVDWIAFYSNIVP